MATKFSRRLVTLCSSLAAAAGCSQVLGISDYKVDPQLDQATGAGGDGNGKGKGGDNGTAGTKPSTAGTKNEGGSPNGGRPSSEAGAPDQPTAGSPTGDAGAAGAAPTGTVVQCDSAACCTNLGGTAVGVEMLKDGGFELGTPNDGSPWTEVSTNDVEIISLTDKDGTGLLFKSHTGDYYAYLSGLPGETSTINSPNFVVPKDAGWMTISGYRRFQVDTADNTNQDFCGIALYDPAVTTPAELPFFWGNPTNGHVDGWAATTDWKRFEKSWDAIPHQGTKRYLGLRGSSDKYSTDVDVAASSYLFDDVSLKVYRCYK